MRRRREVGVWSVCVIDIDLCVDAHSSATSKNDLSWSQKVL